MTYQIFTAAEFDALDYDEMEALDREDVTVLVHCTDGQIRKLEDTEILYGEGWKMVGFEVK